ncbi:hypothetical protein JCM3765_001806 [Sporobolomyces pararoseus]
MDDTFNTQLNRGDSSLAGYASTAGLSTREPLIERPPHVLLGPFNSLLDALLIPLNLSSLALATPTLILTVLEALLETRIIDVPEDYRGSWERAKRTKVAEVVVQAIGEVLDGLARAGAKERDEEWRSEAVQIRGIVRGTEAELAKLVHGLLKIARGLRIDFDDSAPTPRATHVVVDAISSSRRPLLAPKDLSKPSSNHSFLPSSSSTANPSTLFAPRPLRQSTLSVKPLSRSVSSSISSSSSHSSRSTSLTIPYPHHRPSLFNELERSGTLSPPPRMPGSPRRHQNRVEMRNLEEEGKIQGKKKRSTLELMRDSQTRRGAMEEADGAERRTKNKGKGKEKEIDDVFSTPRNVEVQNNLDTQAKEERTTRSKTSRKRETEASVKSNSSGPDQATIEERTKVKGKEKRASDQKGKERAREKVRMGERTVPSSSTEEECCRECRAELSTGKDQVSIIAGPDPSTLPSKSMKDKPHSVSAQPKEESMRTRKNAKWCQCQSEKREDYGSLTTEEEDTDASTSSTLGKTERRAKRLDRSTNKRAKDREKKPSTELSASTSSQQARRVRVAHINRTVKLASTLKEDAGDLSVHGESEIERFEASRQTSSPALVDHSPPQRQQPVTPSSSSAQHDTVLPATTPSPYTMLLLAQRARLAEKLRALELRERDRTAARQATEGAQG